ncbi:MAG: 4Fe-4S binding protein [Candidatus Eisenbacteria bacterium]|nr:4Fe-4S binding protein [Candidatus Eisenbacteria bacterium]
MSAHPAVRQRLRRLAILLSLLLFPVILNYLSPVIILDSASRGVANASLFVFAGLFVAALFVGRLWCSWVCPGAGLQEACAEVNSRPVKPWVGWMKWVIWVPWVAAIVFLAARAGGYRSIGFFYHVESGVSVDRPVAYFIYYTVVLTFAVIPLLGGRRAACHSICWMAPFMILGRRARNRLRWPALRLVADAERCRNCRSCTGNCPMSLDVNGLVRAGSMEHTDCILCGTCVDNCPRGAIRYSFSRG